MPFLDNNKKTVILDLDETLIHTTISGKATGTYYLINMGEMNGVPVKGQVRLRPGVREFLQALRPHFEVGVFTASQKEYAE